MAVKPSNRFQRLIHPHYGCMQSMTQMRSRMTSAAASHTRKRHGTGRVSWWWWNSSVSWWQWWLQDSTHGAKYTYTHTNTTEEIWVRSGAYTNVSFLVLMMYMLYTWYYGYSFVRCHPCGKLDEGYTALSVLFLQLPVGLHLLQKKKKKI